MSTDMLQIVIIGYVWPEPNSSAAGQNMLSLIRQFTDNGHHVTFMTAACDSPHKADLNKVNVENIALNCSSFNLRIAALSPDVVIFDRYMTEEQFSWRVKEACPNAIRILNTEDLHSLRQARHNAVKATGDASKANYSTELAQREIAAILRSDLTLVISRAELALLRHYYQVPCQQLFYHPLKVSTVKKPLATFEQRADIVTIGNFRHAPNWDAVLQLKQEIWPAIRKKLPQVNLHIYGAYPPKKATQLHNPSTGFYVDGWAENAKKVIENAKLLIAPLRFGAGIKGKLLEAMACGTPTLTTWIGAEGITKNPTQWGGAVCDTSEAFAEHAQRLYTDKQQWLDASECGLALFEQYNQETESETLDNKILALANNINAHRDSLFLQGLLWHQTLNASKYMSQWIEAKNRSS